MQFVVLLLILALVPGSGEAQQNPNARRAMILKDSSAARVLAEFRAGHGAQNWGREVLKVVHASGQTAKADELADSLAAIVIRRLNNPSAGEAEVNLSIGALISLAN